MNQAAGICAALTAGPAAVTAEMTLQYKKRAPLPSVVLCRTVAIKKENRKLWIRGTIEDGTGTVYCTAQLLFVIKKQENL
ncbi:hypothetical protein MMC12_007555 [Toensbergia leucococca]|nr:hypothetical protein [Toensbergia leucococca]